MYWKFCNNNVASGREMGQLNSKLFIFFIIKSAFFVIMLLHEFCQFLRDNTPVNDKRPFKFFPMNAGNISAVT